MAEETKPLNLDQKIAKKNYWHTDVKGAYVGEPTPDIVGLPDDDIIMSADASALYPTITILSNISLESLHSRIYDTGAIKNLITLLQKVFKMKDSMSIENIKKQVLPAFNNALQMLVKTYFKNNNSNKNKKESTEITLTFYNYLFDKIISYDGKLEDIFKPIDDRTYKLLRSYFFPLIEAINWLSPQNRGYNNTILDWIFFGDTFEEKYKNQDIYLFDNYNNVQFSFKIIDVHELIDNYFTKFILNPYGSLYFKHDDLLAYEVDEIIKALQDRRKVKNAMLALEAVVAKIDSVEAELSKLFITDIGPEVLTDNQVNTLFDLINDPVEERQKRIQSMKYIDFEKISFKDFKSLQKYLQILIDQLDTYQLGIKVNLNSGYGILGLITYAFADIIAANSITTAGKIYGIKTFQSVTTWVMDKYQEQLPNYTGMENLDIDMELIDDTKIF